MTQYKKSLSEADSSPKDSKVRIIFVDTEKSKTLVQKYKDELSLEQVKRVTQNLQKTSRSARLESCSLGDDRVLLFAALPKQIDIHKRQKFLKSHLKRFLTSKFGPAFVDLSALNRKLQLDILFELEYLVQVSDYKPEKYSLKSKQVQKKAHPIHFKTGIEKKAATHVVQSAAIKGQAVNHLRSLADMPGNKLTPKAYRNIIQKRAKSENYKYSFMGQTQLEKKGAGAFLAVTQGLSKNEGGIVHLSQNSKPRSPIGRLNIIGKGICFDTGGYNIKASQFMAGMQKDMGGSALALSLFETLIQLEPRLEINAYLALAENIVSEKAYRPSDVVTASNGVTIEVVDTDAEGRMVLSDTLAIASSKKADLTLTFATLTGAAVRSVGTKRAAVFTRNHSLHSKIFKATDVSGERVWPFPIGDEFYDGLKSDVADTLQCSTKPNADHIHAATFLSKFVTKEGDWVHMDLSSATSPGGLGLTSSDTTGFGVLWSTSFVREYFGSKR